MGQERLSLTLMHIHYQVKIVLDEVVNVCHRTPTEAGARDYSVGLIPKYFNVSFYIVKLVLCNLLLFDKCNIQFLPCTLPLQFLMYCYFP